MSFPDLHLKGEVERKGVNSGGEKRSKVSCNYSLTGQKKAIEWFKKKINVTLKEHKAVVQKNLVNK